MNFPTFEWEQFMRVYRANENVRPILFPIAFALYLVSTEKERQTYEVFFKGFDLKQKELGFTFEMVRQGMYTIRFVPDVIRLFPQLVSYVQDQHVRRRQQHRESKPNRLTYPPRDDVQHVQVFSSSSSSSSFSDSYPVKGWFHSIHPQAFVKTNDKQVFIMNEEVLPIKGLNNVLDVTSFSSSSSSFSSSNACLVALYERQLVVGKVKKAMFSPMEWMDFPSWLLFRGFDKCESVFHEKTCLYGDEEIIVMDWNTKQEIIELDVSPFASDELGVDVVKSYGNHHLLVGRGEYAYMFDVRQDTKPAWTCVGLPGRMTCMDQNEYYVCAGNNGAQVGACVWDVRKPTQTLVTPLLDVTIHSSNNDVCFPRIDSVLVRPECIHVTAGSSFYTYGLTISDTICSSGGIVRNVHTFGQTGEMACFVATETPFSNLLNLNLVLDTDPGILRMIGWNVNPFHHQTNKKSFTSTGIHLHTVYDKWCIGS